MGVSAALHSFPDIYAYRGRARCIWIQTFDIYEYRMYQGSNLWVQDYVKEVFET